MNTTNLKMFPTMVGYTGLTKKILQRDENRRGLEKYERMCPWA